MTCRRCGLSEAEHHKYELEMPKGCVCPPQDWVERVFPVCQMFEQDPSGVMPEDCCKSCQHRRGCHAEGKP